MLLGNFQYALDEKGRASVPAPFRNAVCPRAEDIVILSPGASLSEDPEKTCLWCQPRAVWEEMERKIDAMPNKQDLRRYLVQQAVECSLDKLGRILIPQHLREIAGLKDQIVWAGASVRIELWDAAVWNGAQKKLGKDAAVARAIAEL